RPAEDRQRGRAEGAKAACERCGYLEGGQVARDWDWHGAANLKGASNEPARGAAMTSGPQLTKTVCYGALDPPVGGTLHFENLVMPPLTKTCPKMVLSDKGGSLCVKDVFAKKFFGAGRDSAGGALASVLWKHSSEGRTPDAAERCVRHCAGSRPRDRDLPPRFRTDCAVR